MGINKVILVGRVGKDPEVQYIKEDVPVAKFTFATTESYKNREGQKVENTEWHNIVIWRGLAKVVEQYVKKGDLLYLEGKITNRQYEKDGVTKYFTEIVVNNMEMLGGKSSGANGGGSQQYSTPQNATQKTTTAPTTQMDDNNVSAPAVKYDDTPEDDDLPF